MLLSQRNFVSVSVFACCFQVCLTWKTISCQTDKGNRVKHSQFLQGTCVEDESHMSCRSQGFAAAHPIF